MLRLPYRRHCGNNTRGTAPHSLDRQPASRAYDRRRVRRYACSVVTPSNRAHSDARHAGSIGISYGSSVCSAPGVNSRDVLVVCGTKPILFNGRSPWLELHRRDGSAVSLRREPWRATNHPGIISFTSVKDACDIIRASWVHHAQTCYNGP